MNIRNVAPDAPKINKHFWVAFNTFLILMAAKFWFFKNQIIRVKNCLSLLIHLRFEFFMQLCSVVCIFVFSSSVIAFFGYHWVKSVLPLLGVRYRCCVFRHINWHPVQSVFLLVLCLVWQRYLMEIVVCRDSCIIKGKASLKTHFQNFVRWITGLDMNASVFCVCKCGARHRGKVYDLGF